MPINRQIQEKCRWITKSKSLGLHDELQRSPSLHDEGARLQKSPKLHHLLFEKAKARILSLTNAEGDDSGKF